MSNAWDFSGKVAVLTGAGRGIGLATANLLLDHGVSLLATARSMAGLEKLQSPDRADRLDLIAGDIADEGFVGSLFQRLDQRFGRIDFLINNAGVGHFAPLEAMSVAAFRESLNVNVLAAFMCMQQAIPRMIAGGRPGRVLNVASVRAHWTERGDGGAYNASKAGLAALTQTVARQFHGSGHPISVGMISPGGTNTDLTNPKGYPRPSFMSPDSVAAQIAHILAAPDDINVMDLVFVPLAQMPW